MKQFDYCQDFKNLDFRQHPELYRVGKGEQGVLLIYPIKQKFCLSGDLRLLKLPGSPAAKFTRYF
jgi:hypothetical protein